VLEHFLNPTSASTGSTPSSPTSAAHSRPELGLIPIPLVVSTSRGCLQPSAPGHHLHFLRVAESWLIGRDVELVDASLYLSQVRIKTRTWALERTQSPDHKPSASLRSPYIKTQDPVALEIKIAPIIMKNRASQTTMMRIAIAGGGGFSYILAQELTQTANPVLVISRQVGDRLRLRKVHS
jgi:hypothetical protein